MDELLYGAKLMGDRINVGGIEADVGLNTGNLSAECQEAERKLAQVQAEMERLSRAFQAAPGDLKAFESELETLISKKQSLIARIGEMKAALDSAAVSTRSFTASAAGVSVGASGASKATDEATKAARGFGQALMQVGYIVDDAQYGFQGLVNNIAPLAYNLGQAFGVSGPKLAGLAASAQIAAVAAYQLYQRWDEVREAFGDTSGQQKAMESLEGMIGLLKQLQADAGSFSWGDSLAMAFGLNPDAGKGLKAAGLKVAVEAKESAEKNAKVLDSGKSEEVAKEEGRFKEAIVEVGGGKPDAMKNVTKRVADKLMAESNVQSFLSPVPKETVASSVTAGALPELKGPSDRQEYQTLIDRQKAGQKLSHDELTRKADLEQRALEKATETAREQIGAAFGDLKAAGRIGDLIGGEAGDVLAGRKETKKDTAKADEASDKEGEKSKALRKVQVREIVQKQAPDLKETADKLAAKVETGAITREVAVETIRKRLDTPELSPEEQEKTAEEAFVETEKDVPADREKRLNRKAEEKAREKVPDLKSKADRLADRVHKKEMTTGAAQDLLVQDLTAEGVDEDDARRVARVESDRTAKEDPLKRSARLRRESISKAEEIVPDLKDKVEAEVAKGKFSPTGDASGRGELKDLLLKGGMDKDEADSAVKDLFRKGTEDVNQRLANVTGPRKDDQPSRSEVYRTSDLTDRIQSAIGNDDEAKKHTQQNEKIIATLEKIANKASNGDGWEVT